MTDTDTLSILAEIFRARPEHGARIRQALEGAAAAGHTIGQLLDAYDLAGVGEDMADALWWGECDEGDRTFARQLWDSLTGPQRRALAVLARGGREMQH